MKRVYNFSAGPSALPEAVLRRAAEEMLDYQGSGQSAMEISHRSKIFEGIIESMESYPRELMNILENYKVLLLQGGGWSQFTMVPLNLMVNGGKADFVATGQWVAKAQEEAPHYGKARIVASSKDEAFSYIPELDPAIFTSDADCFYICMNSTIYGTRYTKLPETGNMPLVADISSCILSKPIDVSRFGLLFASAQKNVAPAGLTMVVAREDLIGHAKEFTPTMLNCKIRADSGSLFNTSLCYPIYIHGLVLEWIKSEFGSLEGMKAHNEKKAGILYDFLDQSRMFRSTVVKKDHPLMNVPFVTGNGELDGKFVKEAEAAGFVNLKGYRSVGGMRASIYNAMPIEGVQKLVDPMTEFGKNNA